MTSLFPARLLVSPHRRPPGPCESGFILPWALPLLQSFNRSRPVPAVACENASLGVPFPIATSTERVHLRASIPSSLYGPSSAFLTPSTVCSSHCLAGLFHPTATSGIHLPGFFSRYPARATRRRPVPSCRLAAVACHRVASTAPAPPTPSPGLCSGQRFEATDDMISIADASIPS